VSALVACVHASALAQAPAGSDEIVATAPGAEAFDVLVAPAPGGLTLAGVVRRIVTTSPAVRRARKNVSGARAGVARARSAFFPRLELSASYTLLSPVERPPLVIDLGGGAGGIELPNAFPQYANNYVLLAAASVPVSDFFLTIVPTYRGAERLEVVAQARVDAQRIATAQRATEVFFQFVRAESLRRVTAEAVRLAEESARLVRVRAGAGVMQPIDLALAEARLGEARAGQARAVGAAAGSAVVLRRLLRLAPDARIAIADPLVIGRFEPAPRLESVVREALARRPELRAMRAVVEAREAAATAEQGRQWPRLGVAASAQYSNPNPRIFPAVNEFRASWDLSVVLSWSPNDLLRASAATDIAESELAQAQEDLLDLEDAIAIEAAGAASEYDSARVALETGRESARLAAEAYRVRLARFLAGAGDVRDVLDSQASLARAWVALVEGYVECHLARARLARARQRA